MYCHILRQLRLIFLILKVKYLPHGEIIFLINFFLDYFLQCIQIDIVNTSINLRLTIPRNRQKVSERERGEERKMSRNRKRECARGEERESVLKGTRLRISLVSRK